MLNPMERQLRQSLKKHQLLIAQLQAEKQELVRGNNALLVQIGQLLAEVTQLQEEVTQVKQELTLKRAKPRTRRKTTTKKKEE